MNDFDSYVSKALYKSESKIRKLCLPLEESLEIPFFSYFYLDEQGHYCNISNSLKELEHYYANHIYTKDPYSCNPKFFQQEYKIIQPNSDIHLQSMIKEKFQIDKLFQILYKHDNYVEGFIFAQKNKSYEDCIHFFDKISLLEKFAKYFKVEARTIIRSILEQGYNLKTVLGSAFEEPSNQLVVQNAEKYTQFLKKIDNLSPRENQCISFYKQGHSAQTTAAKLGLSQRTVEHYLDNARLKFGFQSKREFLEI